MNTSAVVPAFALALASCAARSLPVTESAGASQVPVAETRSICFPHSEQLRWRTRVLVHSDGRVERHGEAFEWYADGTPRAQSFYEHDRPAGVWSSWYEDGTRRSLIDFGNGVSPAPMRFWHDNGQLAGEGAGVFGVKDGRWTYWHPDGGRARQGTYVGSVREGAWTFWYPNGSRQAEGVYRHGRRVGEWRLWDADGLLVVRQATAEWRDGSPLRR